MRKWTKEELKTLRTYDNQLNEFAAIPQIFRDSITEQQILTLEAKLHTINKAVIGYLGNEPIGLFSFNEAIREEQYNLAQGKIFTYHPVNFRNMKHYVLFLNKEIKIQS